ncbi:hypothetical protein OAJ90_05955 [Nitrosopumilus sp.]|nr:hypothetical protein [Nitrosopumilus sp.]
MIGIMIPSAYAGHSTFEGTLSCKFNIHSKLSQDLETPISLTEFKNNIFDVATDCVKGKIHQISDSCTTVNNETRILKSIEELKEIGKTENIGEKLAKLQISKWTCSPDTLDAEFNISSKFGILKAQYENRILSEEQEYQEYVDYNKGRLTWITDCSEKGKIIIQNIKEYGNDGITLKNIDSYNYQILDDMSNPIINEINHTGEIVLLHQEYPKARYIQMSGDKGLDERRDICSNYFAIDFFDIELVCPTSSEYYVVENYSNDETKYSFNLQDSASFGFQNNKDSLQEINVEAHYSDGQIISEPNYVFSVPVKNENSMISYVVLTAEDHYPQELQYSCEITPFMEKTLVTLYQNEKLAESEAVKAVEKAAETRDYCNEEINGCKPIYKMSYEINAPNEFFYKSWTEESLIDDIESISYSFTKNSNYSFFVKEYTNFKNGASNYDPRTEEFGVFSMFIPAKSPINEKLIEEEFEIERKNMNFAGMNRDVVHIKTITSDKTIIGFLDSEGNYYYDWNTGILLKKEFSRTLLDTTGQTNYDKITIEISQINFPKNSGGGCLIATATYGSEMSQQVQQLRELRDNQLLQTESGTAFMSTFNNVYYSFSPIIADYERENPLFKEAIKLAITPMIATLSLMENAESESEVLSIGISVIVLNLGMYLAVPVIVIVEIRKRF